MVKINEKTLQKLKEKLGKEKKSLESELKKFAKKSKGSKEDWSANFPLFNGETGGAALEVAADEIEEYENILPIEHSLEVHLQNINLALKKMKKGVYGICEKCGKKIEVKRLKVYPEARFCLKCSKPR